MKLYRLLNRLFVIVLAAGLLLSACSASPNGGSAFAFEKEPLATGDLTAHVTANGIVRPTRSVQLSWKTSGQVDQMMVAEGDAIRQGQKLAQLLESSLPTSILAARLDLIEAQRALQNLQTSRTNVEQAHLALVDAKEALDKATQRYNAVAGVKRYVSDSYIDGARAELMMAETEVDQAQNAYDHLAGRPDDDPEKAIALKLLSQAKQARDRALGNLNYLTGSPTSKEVERAEVELALAQAQLEDAQRNYDRVKDGVPPEDLAAAQTRIQIAQATLDQAFVFAPFDGTITRVAPRAGDLVQPGDLALVVEDQSHLYIDAQISEIDVNRIHLDQYVEVTLDAIYGRTFSGKVIEIGVTGTSAQGVVNFPVRVELIDRDPSIRSGMTAVLRVQVEQVNDALLVPNRAVRMLDGQRVVYIDKGGPMPVAVPIVLGVSSETMSQVLEGDVKAGDLVILNPDIIPSETNIEVR